jgi:hypothetical protein
MTETDYRTVKFQGSKFANKNLEVAENLRVLALLSHQLHLVDLRFMKQRGKLNIYCVQDEFANSLETC